MRKPTHQNRILTTWGVSKHFFFARMLLAIVDYPSYDIWFIKKFNLKFHGFVPSDERKQLKTYKVLSFKIYRLESF